MSKKRFKRKVSQCVTVNNEKTISAKLAYNKQRNFCTSLVRRTKKYFYSQLNPSDISDNKNFWKIVKPFFSEKTVTSDNITIIKDNEIYERMMKKLLNYLTIFLVVQLATYLYLNVNIQTNLLEKVTLY